MPTVISTSWSGRLPSTRNELVAKTCSLYGFSSLDSELVTRALDWLDDSVKDLNHAIWQGTLVAESGIVLTEGQQWFNLNSRCYKESQAYLTHNTTGDLPPMKFLPWVHFKRLYPSTDTTQLGQPSIYTIFNEQRDAKIYLFPLPDNDTVTNYTMAVEYYQRLPLISGLGANDAPEIPEEFENVILYGAYKRFAMHLGKSDEVKMYSALESEALERMKQIDSMRPDADRRFRLIDTISVSPFWGG